jgi:hypothetical protein
LEISAPLCLLVPTAETETADILRKAASSNGILTITSGQPEHNGCIIQVSGMQLKMSVSGAGDITGFKNIFCNIDEASIGSVVSIALGHHLDGGEKVPAIVKSMLSAAAMIGAMTGAFAAMWLPARTISGFDYFARVVAEYDEGGVFPVLALVNFRKEDDGTIRSTGLDWLAGQELAVAPSHLSDSELMRRIVRVAHDLAVGGAITGDLELAGIEDNERIVLSPDIAGRTLMMRTAPAVLQ